MIACVTSALFDYLPPLVRALQAARPDAAVSVREMDTADAVEALRRGEVDLALLRLERDRHPLRLKPLGRDMLAARCRWGMRWLRIRPPCPSPRSPTSQCWCCRAGSARPTPTRWSPPATRPASHQG
jgi:DNA-binding transcriptional LysR family regulator